MRTKNDASQLEFDWLDLHLVNEPTLDELEAVRRKVSWPAPKDWNEVQRLRDLTVRLSWLDIKCDERRVSLNDELREARVLLGSEWAKEEKFWRRMAKRDPLRFKKILLVARKQLGLA